MFSYAELVERRRSLEGSGDFVTLAHAEFDVQWVTPYQILSHAADGPVLVAHHWLDAASAERYRRDLSDGYLPSMPFNRVLQMALDRCGLTRRDIYVTQALHLLPKDKRCGEAPRRLVNESFDEVTRHELRGRRVIALGQPAAAACRHHGFKVATAPHPSARIGTYEQRAQNLATLLR